MTTGSVQQTCTSLVAIFALCLTAAASSAQLATTGDLLVADAGADAVFVVDIVTGQQSVLAAGPPLSDPSGIAVDPTTNLIYVTDRSGGPGGVGALIEIDPSDGSMAVVSSGNQLAMPEDVIVRGSSGAITVIDGVSGLVDVDPVSGVQTIDSAQTGSAITRLALSGSPRSADRIFVVPGPLEIRRFIASDGSTPLVGQGGNFQLPTGITTRGPSFNFAMVSDAGNLLSGDGQVIEVRITNFSDLNPSDNQRVVASGIHLADPLDLVTDNAGVFLYIVDPAASAGAGAVIRVDSDTGDQVVLSSGGSFVDPVAIELYPLINSTEVVPPLYLVDSSVAEVLRVDTLSGAQTSIASGGLLVEPSHIVSRPGSSDLFVADKRLTDPGAILRIDANNGAQSLITEGGNLDEPQALILLQSGDLLVADAFMPALVRVSVDSGAQTVIAGVPADLQALAQTGDGQVYGLRESPAAVLLRIDLAGGGTQTVGSGGDLDAPIDLIAENAGTLVVLTSTGNVVRITPDAYDSGNPAGNQVLVSSGNELVSPTGIGVAPNNSFYVSDPGASSGAGAVVRVPSTGGSQSITSSGDQLVTPAAITSARPAPRPGDIIVSDANQDRIVLIDAANGDQHLITVKGLLAFPDGIALDLDGTLLVAETQNNLIVRVDLATGAQTIVASGPDLPDPRAVTLGTRGEIFVGNRVSPFPITEIDRVTGNTTVIAVAVTTFELSGLQKLAVDPATGLLFGTTNVVGFNVSGDSVLQVDPDALPLPTTPQIILSGVPLANANEMVFAPNGSDIFVANGSDILRVDKVSGASSIVSEGGFFDRAQGLAMDAQGQLLTTTVFGDSVIRVDPETGAQELVSFSNLLRQPQGIVVIPIPEPGAFASSVTALLTVALVFAKRRRRGYEAS